MRPSGRRCLGGGRRWRPWVSLLWPASEPANRTRPGSPSPPASKDFCSTGSPGRTRLILRPRSSWSYERLSPDQAQRLLADRVVSSFCTPSSGAFGRAGDRQSLHSLLPPSPASHRAPVHQLPAGGPFRGRIHAHEACEGNFQATRNAQARREQVRGRMFAIRVGSKPHTSRWLALRNRFSNTARGVRGVFLGQHLTPPESISRYSGSTALYRSSFASGISRVATRSWSHGRAQS